MAKKKTEEPKDDKSAKDAAQSPPEESGKGEAGADNPEAAKKKKKLILIAGIGGVGLAAASVGGFFVMKTFSTPHDMKAQQLPEAAGDKKDSKSDEKTKGDGHADDNAHGKDPKAEGSHGSDEKGKAKEEAKDEGKGHGAKDSQEKAADPHSSSDGTKSTKHDGHGAPATDQNAFGDTIDIPKMELNLGNPLENRFLRFGLSIEYHGGEEQKTALNRRMPQIRDVVITMISKKSRIELLSSNGKEAFRKQLKNSLNELLDKPISNVYFTEFLVE